MLVGDHDDRRALRVELVDQAHDRLAGRAVEVARRLVREHDRGASDQRPRDRDPLPLAARQLGRPGGEPVAETDPGERLGRALTPLADGDAGVQQPVGDVLERGRVLGEEELLEDEADPRRAHCGQLAVGHLRRVEAGDRHPPRARTLERPHQVQERRLARPGRPDDRRQLAGADAEAHALQRGNRRVRPVRLRHGVELEHRRRGRDGHDAGTTMRRPAESPEPLTWTSPLESSNRPGSTADEPVRATGLDHLDRVAAAREREQRVDGHDEHALDGGGRDRDVDRRLVETAGRGSDRRA